MTEREIEAVLQTTPRLPIHTSRDRMECSSSFGGPNYRDQDGERGLCTYEPHWTSNGEPDYLAMARAVAKQVVGPLEERITALQGDGSGHLHSCARVNGVWACDKACRVADREALLARVVEAAHAYLMASSRLQMMDGNIQSRRAQAREALASLLADAGAGKERDK